MRGDSAYAAAHPWRGWRAVTRSVIAWTLMVIGAVLAVVAAVLVVYFLALGVIALVWLVVLWLRWFLLGGVVGVAFFLWLVFEDHGEQPDVRMSLNEFRDRPW